tara:strand:+ start:416 stop:2185 length:1770 start_codon:yes stop_codon:yes gene_type:complete
MKLIKKYSLNSILLISIFISQSWINLFYITTRNPDFSKYYDYINYFMGLNVEIDYGQNTIYYLFVTMILKSKIELIDFGNLEYIISSSVQNLNLILFLISLLGFFKLLKEIGFKNNSIILSLSLYCFFPQALFARAIMKPEILVLALFPWSIYYFEKYLKNGSIYEIYKAIPFLALICNTKASVAGMTIVYFLISYYEILKNIKLKNFIIFVSSFIILFTVIQYENYKITDNLIYERVYEEEYDFKADKSIIFKIDIDSVLKKPLWIDKTEIENYNKNAQSISNILILDTFGDYFDQFFGTDFFKSSRKNIFVSGDTELFNSDRQIRYNGPFSEYLVDQLEYVRKYVAVLLSLIFFYLIIFFGIKYKEHKKFLYLPLLSGVIIMYFNAIGFPRNNFAPYKGDTFKAFYLFFLLSISFLYLSSHLFQKITKLKLLLSVVFVICIFFIGGHPKQNNQEISEGLVIRNEFAVFCELNNAIFFNNSLNFVHKSGNMSDLESDCQSLSLSRNKFKKSFFKVNTSDPYYKKCLYKGEINIKYSNYVECRMFAINEVRRKNESIVPRYPYFSILTLIICIGIIIRDKKNYNYKIIS